MPKREEVTVAGRKYPVTEKVSGVSEKWRKHLRETPLFTTFQSLDNVVAMVISIVEGGIDKLEGGQVIPLAQFLPAIVSAMANSMDDINALVYDYVPEMAKDREWLRKNAFDSEIVQVFIVVLKINFPILGALELIRGLRASGTYTNSPSTNNGGNGMKENTAQLKSR